MARALIPPALLLLLFVGLMVAGTRTTTLQAAAAPVARRLAEVRVALAEEGELQQAARARLQQRR